MIHWFLWFTGANDEGGSLYGFWSGFGGSVPDAAIIVAMSGWWWHHTCHVSRCWHIGRHPVSGTPYKACRRHHPDGGKLTHAALLAEHRRQQ
jgi:hypothetical protein